ncbi:ATP-binding cassette domain-containing protein, partial [Pseudomonas sp. SB113]|uniref:ATP-binding cassette domain-containing protein n=1 Tax=Pseudomonas sp. SB113 TaxID=3154123 RepID=UPI00345C6887
MRFGQYPFELSGGMCQRAMIAMALICRPKLLIADEPTTALDVTIQAQILDLMKRLRDETGTAILLITHDMGVVAEISDRTVVMYKGEAVETGTTEDIFASANHPYTRALLSAVPQLGSMTGTNKPLRFPIVDLKTGMAEPVKPTADTVKIDAEPILKVDHLVTRFD